MEDTKRRLLWHGMFLFLLGLLTGLVKQKFNNPRMGLAAHLEGVMNGTFLVALGVAWTEVRLPSRLKAAAYWSALYGTYTWAVTTRPLPSSSCGVCGEARSGDHRNAARSECALTTRRRHR